MGCKLGCWSVLVAQHAVWSVVKLSLPGRLLAQFQLHVTRDMQLSEFAVDSQHTSWLARAVCDRMPGCAAGWMTECTCIGWSRLVSISFHNPLVTF